MPSGVYDRATSAWQPKPLKQYPPELVALVRELYEGKGHSMRETAQLAGITLKVLDRLMRRHGITARRAVRRNQDGSANPSWRGDAAAYSSMHQRVEAVRGKPKRCSCCDTTDPAQRYEWANLTGHYEDPRDYVRLCQRCHWLLDRRRRTALGRNTTPG
jgi:hypothetical protein